MKTHNFSTLGWGKFSDVGIATELLQTATVPIVENSKCKERMNKAELRPGDEDLLVCTGGSRQGPCKVDTNYPARLVWGFLEVIDESQAQIRAGVGILPRKKLSLLD